MCQNRRALGVHPFVAVCVIEMPVRVDEMFDWFRAYLPQSFGDLGARSRITGIDNELAIRSRDTAMFPPEPMSALTFSRSACTIMLAVSARLRAVSNNIFLLGEELTRRQPCRIARSTGGSNKATARKRV